MTKNSKMTTATMKRLANLGIIAVNRTTNNSNLANVAPTLHNQLRLCKSREEEQEAISFYNDVLEMWSDGSLWK